MHELFVEAHQHAGEVLRPLAAFRAHRVDLVDALGEVARSFIEIAKALVERGVGLADLVLRGARGFRHQLGMARDGLGELVGLRADVFSQLGQALAFGAHLADEHFGIGAHDLGGLHGGSDAGIEVALQRVEARARVGQRAAEKLGLLGDGFAKAGDFRARGFGRFEQHAR